MYALRTKFHPYSCIARQRGIGLMETIMATLVGMFLLVMMLKWMMDSTNDLRAKRNADSLQQFSQIAGMYLEANRDGLVKAMTDGTGAALYCQVNANVTTGLGGTTANNTTKHTCVVDTNWFLWKRLLPPGTAAVNPYGQRWAASYRLVYAHYDEILTNPETTQGDVEILVVGTGSGAGVTTASTDELGITTVLMGGVGGMVLNTSPPVPAAPSPSLTNNVCPDGNVCGSNGWRATLSNFIY